MNGSKPKSQKQQLSEFIRKIVSDELDRKMAAIYKDLKIELLEYMVRNGGGNSPQQPIFESDTRRHDDSPRYDVEENTDLRRVMKNLNSMPGRAEVAKLIVNEPPRYSSDPMLNEMLTSTLPHQDNAEPDSILDTKGGYIVGIENKVVDATNPKVKAVLQNINRDYRSMLKLTEEKVNAERGRFGR